MVVAGQARTEVAPLGRTVDGSVNLEGTCYGSIAPCFVQADDHGWDAEVFIYILYTYVG
jgi:hypothetical protein